MHVDAAVRRNIEHRLGQQLAVGHHDDDLGCQRTQTRLLIPHFERVRLKDRDIMRERQRFHRRRSENLLAAPAAYPAGCTRRRRHVRRR